MCGNYSREETIQGRKLYEEIRYVIFIGENLHTVDICNSIYLPTSSCQQSKKRPLTKMNAPMIFFTIWSYRKPPSQLQFGANTLNQFLNPSSFPTGIPMQKSACKNSDWRRWKTPMKVSTSISFLFVSFFNLVSDPNLLQRNSGNPARKLEGFRFLIW